MTLEADFTMVGRRQDSIQQADGCHPRQPAETIRQDTIAQTSPFADYATPTVVGARALCLPKRRHPHRMVRVNRPASPSAARTEASAPAASRSNGFGTNSQESSTAIRSARLANYAERDQQADLPWSSNGLRDDLASPHALRAGRSADGIGTMHEAS